MGPKFLGWRLIAVCWVVFALGTVSCAGELESATWETSYDRPAVEIGGTVADDGGSADIGILAPLIFSEGTDLLFLGADARIFSFDPSNVDETIYNAGAYLGYRKVLGDSSGVIGLWAGLDHLRTEESNDFTRAVAGVEFFGRHVIARANAFVPLDSTSREWQVTSGGFINTYDEKIPNGFDAEIGLRMAVPMQAFSRASELRVFAGGYDFIGLDDDGGDVFGGRGRLEFDLYPFEESPNTRLSLEAGYAFDKHSGDQFSGGLKLSIPLGITNNVEASHGKDADIVALDSFGQDLFQPVRRNREPVSRIRLKDRRPVAVGNVNGFSLTNVCGGASGSLSLSGGLASSSVKQGALIGIIEPNGAAASLSLNLGAMVAPDGKTLKQMLSAQPEIVKTTLKFAPDTVNFSLQSVQPAPALALASSVLTGQSIADATVTINGNTCSLDLSVQSAVVEGLTLARVCGGKTSTISLNGGLASTAIKQGALVGTIDPSGAAQNLKLDLGSMVAPNSKTMAQILSAKPTTLNSTFKFAATKVNFATQSVRPASAVALATGLPSQQIIKDITLTVKSLSCSLDIDVEAIPQPQGLTLVTVCGGTTSAINLNSGLAASSVKQGALLGTIDPTGAARALKLEIAGMVAPNGQTLAQLLAKKPAVLTSTFVFPQSTVNFSSQTVQPSAAVALVSGLPANQSVKGATLTVNSKACSLNVDVETNPTNGLTLATICGGPNAVLPMSNIHGVAMGASTFMQGDRIGTIDPTGAASPLTFTLAKMVDGSGKSLTQLLASKPAALNTTLFLSSAVVDLANSVVGPSPDLANASVQIVRQRLLRFSVIVNGNSCSVVVKNGIKPAAT